MYSKEKREIALKIYHQCGSATQTVQTLGYPSRHLLYDWLKEEGEIKPPRKQLPKIINPPENPRNLPLKVKLDAIKRCYEQGESVQSVSEDIGYSRASIYQWRKRYLKEGAVALMNNKNIKPGTLIEGSKPSNESTLSSQEVEELKSQMLDMQLEIDILKETINVLKKDPGIDQATLKNREKAVIIKVYLSPIVDCFDGMLPCWTIGISPDSNLVNSMLDEAISLLDENEHPIVHSDRGCHYRWPGWIKKIENAGLTRSMSKKGCSPDNFACEGLFGRLKNEMFYDNDWTGVNIEKFIKILNEYLIWYNEKRIKVSLGNMSPMEYRHSLGLTA
ncbi:MAG: IS3 family transposase [Anaerotignum sp.]|nr:IS3 family transposase [Anaerotignum sp.]